MGLRGFDGEGGGRSPKLLGGKKGKKRHSSARRT